MTLIKEAVKRLSKSNTGFDAYIEQAKVIAVDKNALTCSVTLFDNEDLVLTGVKLKAVEPEDLTDMGVVLYPAIGSVVLVAQINNSPEDLFIVGFTKVDTMGLDLGSALKFALDGQAGNISLDLAQLVFNGGKNKGIPLIDPLVKKINRLEDSFNKLLKDFKEHKHIGVQPGGGITGFGDKQTLGQIAEKTLIKDLENKKILQ
jgi:hypothetical protein